MSSSSVIHHSISDDGVIEIVQEESHRSLYFGSDAKQSEMDMSQPERLVLAYTQAMMAGLLFCPAPKSILLIGLGGGSLARFLLHHLPGCNIDVVEFREDVVRLARGYFCLPDDRRLHITIGDGCNFLLSSDKKYDLILIDAFDHDGIAKSIKSIRFFEACYDALNDEGVAAINLWNSQQDQFAETMANIESAFRDHVLDMPVKDKGNVIAFATRARASFPSFRTLKPLAESLEQQLDLTFGVYLRELRRNNRWRALARFF
jgi:spermidine synthase